MRSSVSNQPACHLCAPGFALNSQQSSFLRPDSRYHVIMHLVLQPSLLVLTAMSAVKVSQAMYCSSEYNEWEGCLDKLDGGQGSQSCFSCLALGDIGLPHFKTCDQITQNQCFYRGACAHVCGKCDGLYQKYQECYWGYDCFTGCSGQRPPSSATPCAQEDQEVVQCANDKGDGYDACVSCLQDYVPDTDGRSCEQSELYTCSATKACPQCGDCQDELVTAVNCRNKVLSCDPFTCENDEEAEAPPTRRPARPTRPPARPTQSPEEPSGGTIDDDDDYDYVPDDDDHDDNVPEGDDDDGDDNVPDDDDDIGFSG